MGINNFQPFTKDDVKLFKYICGSDLDGYRAHWDQDQIALCAKVIRSKLEVVNSIIFTNMPGGINTNNITFAKTSNWKKSYYMVPRIRRVVKNIKAEEKKKAIELKKERTRLYSLGKIVVKNIQKKVFKRPIVRKKGI